MVDAFTNQNDDPVRRFEECFAAAQEHRGTLYGRESEVERIQSVYQTVLNPSPSSRTAQLVLISGVTGIGKTGLARSLIHQVEDTDGGCFVVGKFDQLQRPEPHSAFVEAFTQFLSRAKKKGKASLFRDALLNQGIDCDNGGHDLTQMIPLLGDILSPNRDEFGRDFTNKQPSPFDELTSSGVSTNRWKDLLRLFLRVSSCPENPLVLLIEDLHWIDECSLDVLNALVEDQRNSGAMFICTYRMEAESNFAGLDRMLQDLKQHDVQISHIHLDGLTRTAATRLVSILLSVTNDRAEPLAWTIYDLTKGNPFLMWKCLQNLHTRNLLSFDPAIGQFCWDVEEIQVEIDSISNLTRFRVETLPENVQEYLKIAACLGSKLDEDILSRLLPVEPNMFSNFFSNVAETWLLSYDEVRGTWCFSHDSVQEAIYHLISLNERSVYHYRIGRKLWREFDIEELRRFLFLVVNQLLLGIKCLKDERERRAISKLCLGAGIRALQFSSFQASFRYFEQGIVLLDLKVWVNDYELAMELYNGAAEVANLLGRFNDVLRLVDQVLAHSRCSEDSLRAKATKVHALGRSNRPMEAIQFGLSVLASLGERLPTNPSRLHIYAEVISTRRKLKRKTNEMLLRLPLMTDTKKLAAMEVMNLLFFNSVFVKPELTPILGSRMVRLSLDHGLSAVCCVGFVIFASSVVSVMQTFKESYRFGRLGLLLLEKFNAKAWVARVSNVYYNMVYPWVRPFSECHFPLLEAYQSGLRSGDTEFGVLCAAEDVFMRFDRYSLPDLVHEIDSLTERMMLYELTTLVTIAKPIRRLLQILTGEVDEHLIDISEKFLFYDVKEFKPNRLLYTWTFIHLSFLHFLFGNYGAAAKHAKLGVDLAGPFYGPSRGSFVALMCGLADAAYARHEKHVRAPCATKLSKLLLRWATLGEPRNFIGQRYLLKAEIAALRGNKARSYNYYIVAIAACREGHFLLQTAIATERLAKSLLEWGENESAKSYFQDAVALYQEWGAFLKVRHLELEIVQHGL